MASPNIYRRRTSRWNCKQHQAFWPVVLSYAFAQQRRAENWFSEDYVQCLLFNWRPTWLSYDLAPARNIRSSWSFHFRWPSWSRYGICCTASLSGPLSLGYLRCSSHALPQRPSISTLHCHPGNPVSVLWNLEFCGITAAIYKGLGYPFWMDARSSGKHIIQNPFSILYWYADCFFFSFVAGSLLQLPWRFRKGSRPLYRMR